MLDSGHIRALMRKGREDATCISAYATLDEAEAGCLPAARGSIEGHAVEAPVIIRKGEYDYLFASFDFCCQGANSTYYTVVGCSKLVEGPYLDREGRKMKDGGGTIVLHADQDTLRRRIEAEHPVPSPFRLRYLEPYAEAARTWLHAEAQVVDTTHLTPDQAARRIADAVRS